MFFMQEDELAIHTVVAASFRVLRDESKKRGNDFGRRVLQGGLFEMARQLNGGELSETQLESLRASGFLGRLEEIAERIKHDPDFRSDQITITGTVDKRTWPTKVANFLKHGERDEPPLPADEIKNELFLMGASAA